jgi:hypothetical protein
LDSRSAYVYFATFFDLCATICLNKVSFAIGVAISI